MQTSIFPFRWNKQIIILSFDKIQNNDLFISPKRKETLFWKSFILSKLDHQMSKSWKRIVAHELQTTSKFDLLKNWVPDCSAQDRISAKSLYVASKKCTSSPVGKIQIFLFLPLCFVLVRLKMRHLFRGYPVFDTFVFSIWPILDPKGRNNKLISFGFFEEMNLRKSAYEIYWPFFMTHKLFQQI